MAGSGFVTATSAGEGPSSGVSSDSTRIPYSQHPYAHDTSLLSKRKLESESENARKKSATNSTSNRESNSDNVSLLLDDNVSPLLDDEVSYPEW